jgi:lipoprotein signal peptidase
MDMDLFSVKKGKALKIINIILFLWLIGLLMMTYALLINVIMSDQPFNIINLKDLLISFGSTGIIASALYYTNRNKKNNK